MPRANRHVPAIAYMALFVLSLGRASAEGDAARRASDIANHTMSPFCPGRTLASCSSPEAAKWRQEIRGWVEQGVPTQEIRARLELRVPGENLSGAPPAPGGWLLPVALSISSALVLLALLRRFRRQSTQAPASAAEVASTPSPVEQGATCEAGESPESALNRRLDAELTRIDE